MTAPVASSPSSPPASARLERIRGVIAAERDALARLLARVDEAAADAVATILDCRGRLIVSGSGKAGLIGQKIAASFRSTGTPASFLHPADALHGDLGLAAAGDVLLLLSKSGETRELVALCTAIRPRVDHIIACCCRPDSTLGRLADIVLDLGIAAEADALNAAPTTSTTAMLALGDALVVAVAAERGLTREQFLALHPAGTLGAQLGLAVSAVMRPIAACPLVPPDLPLRLALVEMSARRLGAIFVAHDLRLVGIFTDGDLRRLLQAEPDPWSRPVSDVMTPEPLTLPCDAYVVDALHLMESRAVTVAPITSADGLVVGAIHLHDLVKAGLP